MNMRSNVSPVVQVAALGKETVQWRDKMRDKVRGPRSPSPTAPEAAQFNAIEPMRLHSRSCSTSEAGDARMPHDVSVRPAAAHSCQTLTRALDVSLSATWTLSSEGPGPSAMKGDTAAYPAAADDAVLADISNQAGTRKHRTPRINTAQSTANDTPPFWTPLLRADSNESLTSVGSSPCPAIVESSLPSQLPMHPSAASRTRTGFLDVLPSILVSSGTLFATERSSSVSRSAISQVPAPHPVFAINHEDFGCERMSQGGCTGGLPKLPMSERDGAASPVPSQLHGTPLSFAATPLAGLLSKGSSPSPQPVTRHMPQAKPVFGRSFWSLLSSRSLTPVANQNSPLSDCSTQESTQSHSPGTSRLLNPDMREMAALVRCLWQ
jgi:hypothetical protein